MGKSRGVEGWALKRISLVICLALLVPALGPKSAGAFQSPAAGNRHLIYGYGPDNGFSDTFCLNCHDIRLAAGEYALMWKNAVTNTCASCHGVYQNAPVRSDSFVSRHEQAGPAATKSVYGVSPAERFIHGGHRLGLNFGSKEALAFTPYDASDQRYTFERPDDAFQNARLPGPNYSYYLNKLDKWTIFVIGEDMSGFLSSNGALGGLFCGSCHSLHGGAGNSLPDKLSNNKQLLSQPNPQAEPIDIDGWKDWFISGYRFCANCHEQRSDVISPQGSATSSGAAHNHPSPFCLQCHGDGSAGTAAADFPHTGSSRLLTEYADLLCVASCHAFALP